MRVLAMDTSSMVASVALIDDEKILGEITFNYKKQHSTILIPMVDRLLTSLDMDIRDVDSVACACGPGSFTGLRIGVSTAKGLCHGAGKPLIGVPTLDGLAYNMAYAPGIICPIMDALRDNVYVSMYRWNKDAMARLQDYMAISVDELIQKLNIYGENIIFLGDGALIQKERLKKEMGDRAQFAPPHLRLQKASSIGYCALKRLQKGDIDNYLNFAPFYLRKSQAEREYEKKHGGAC